MSQVLKVVTSRNEVQEILYTNIRIQESDNLEIRRQKRALKRSVSLYLRSKRRCIEALIQNNFTARDWYCTLTFTEDRFRRRRSRRISALPTLSSSLGGRAVPI